MKKQYNTPELDVELFGKVQMDVGGSGGELGGGPIDPFSI